MNNWKIGTFYTLNTVYEQVYETHLKASCKKMGLEDRLITVQTMNLGNWYANTAQKPRIILNILNTLNENDCLAFLDCDATIEQYPKLFDEIDDCWDISCHYLSWNEWYGYKDSPIKELLSGTLFFRNNEKVRELCKNWLEESSRKEQWEQKVLQDILPYHYLNTYHLPVEYIYIKSLPNGNKPLVEKIPVILHHQISRTVKKGKIV